MALQYDEPTSTSDVMNALQADGTLSSETLNALIALLGLNNPGNLNVGLYDVGSLAAAIGAPNLALIDVGGATSQPLNVLIPAELLNAVKGYIFSGQADLQVNFNTIERAIAMSDGNDTVNVGGDKNTTLSGGGGNDTLLTSGGNDVINGGTGNDTINSGGGADLVISMDGNDVIDTGSGYDMVTMNGTLDGLGIVKAGNTLILTGSGGTTTTVMNTEFVQLSSGTIAVVGSEQEAMALRLYQTLLDRTADSGGAQYWASLVRTGTVSVADIANGFINSPEFQSQFGALSTENYIKLLYQFGLNREAEAGGLNFWLATGLQRADLAVQIVGSAEAASTITDVQVLPGTI
jgi:Ca2+-binding RTX toxin-like protein